MQKLIAIIGISSCLFSTIQAEELKAKQTEIKAPFTAFTGKIARNKVRMRLQPNLESPIIREYNRGDMVIVTGESEDFYEVKPPADFKAYIYRTFVLDNTVEGSRVNVRLDPSVEAAVVAQLNAGDTVHGTISKANNKWLEIDPPASVRFYIAKDFIKNVGDENYITLMQKRKVEVTSLLDKAIDYDNEELGKPFEQIQLKNVVNNYQKIIQDYSEFTEETAKAKDLLTAAQDRYIQKKIAFLESSNQKTAETLNQKNQSLAAEIESQKEKMRQLEERVTVESKKPELSGEVVAGTLNTGWQNQEQALYSAWSARNSDKSMEDYYKEQASKAVIIRGTVQPFNASVKNRPGEFVLLNRNNQTTAYLYSTDLNLQNYVGHEVTMHALPRPNNNFAFPAFIVVAVE